MRYALLLTLLLALLTACSGSSSTPLGELDKVAGIEANTPTLVFVYTAG